MVPRTTIRARQGRHDNHSLRPAHGLWPGDGRRSVARRAAGQPPALAGPRIPGDGPCLRDRSARPARLPDAGWGTGLARWDPVGKTRRTAARLAGQGQPRFDLFRARDFVRDRRAWLNRADGGLACMIFACAPLLDAAGAQIGTRGVGIDGTAADAQQAQLAAAFRRSEVVSEIVAGLRREVLGQDMIRATLAALMGALGAEGCCVADCTPGTQAATILHRDGEGVDEVWPSVGALLRGASGEFSRVLLDELPPDCRRLLIAGFLHGTRRTRGGRHLAWRWRPSLGPRGTDDPERGLGHGRRPVEPCRSSRRWQARQAQIRLPAC